MMKFRPETLVHRVIIKPQIEKVSKGGIVITRSERNQAINTDRGTIFMFGPQAWKAFGCEQSPVQIGDEVYYSHYGAKVLKDEDNGDLYIICNDEDVLVSYTNKSEGVTE